MYEFLTIVSKINKYLDKMEECGEILLCLLMIYSVLIATYAKENICYRPVFLNNSWTDRRPDFVVNMTFSVDGSLTSLTTVNKEINNPVSKILLVQKDANGKVSTLYNATSRLCDVQQLLYKMPILQTIAQNSLRQGNYSFSCPMTEGLYVMNLRFNSKNPFLAILYRPKVVYTLNGGLFEELNKTLLPLSTYYMNIRILKKPCERRTEGTSI